MLWRIYKSRRTGRCKYIYTLCSNGIHVSFVTPASARANIAESIARLCSDLNAHKAQNEDFRLRSELQFSAVQVTEFFHC